MSQPKPTEKAKELVEKFYEEVKFSISHNRSIIGVAKACAVIHCDEMIWFAEFHLGPNDYTVKFYKSVKQEINNL